MFLPPLCTSSQLKNCNQLRPSDHRQYTRQQREKLKDFCGQAEQDKNVLFNAICSSLQQQGVVPAPTRDSISSGGRNVLLRGAYLASNCYRQRDHLPQHECCTRRHLLMESRTADPPSPALIWFACAWAFRFPSELCCHAGSCTLVLIIPHFSGSFLSLPHVEYGA